jgi:hypothetical protein
VAERLEIRLTLALPHALVDDTLLHTMASDVRTWGGIGVEEAVEIGRMAAAVTEPPVAKRQALLAGNAPPAALRGNPEPGLKHFQTVVVLSIETEAGAKLIQRLERAVPSDLGASCFKGCAAVLLGLFASVANRREHGGAGKGNWMRAAHAELPVRRIQEGRGENRAGDR